MRPVLALCISLLACAARPAAPQPSSWPALGTDAEIDAALPRLTNWGRWGPADRRGTLNLISPETVRTAAALVREGRSVSLAREVSVVHTPGIREPLYEMRRDGRSSRDRVGAIWHGFAQTHLDALCHIGAGDRQLYNGVSADSVRPDGCAELGVEVLAQGGISGRGVLLDIAAVRGRALEPGEAVRIVDLEAAEARQRVRVREGDLLAVRTGAGPRNDRERRAGLHPEVLAWVKARGVAVLLGDGDSDVAPFPALERHASPFHSVGIPHLGLPLVDNAELDALATTCERLGRWEFFLVIAPWRLQGTTGAPVNPLAIF